MNRFNVGDKVKATTPDIVSPAFKDEVGVVVDILNPCSDTGQQRVDISYDGCSQIAYALDDGIVLVEKAPKPDQETTQEGDDWGPWRVDHFDLYKVAGAVMVEYDGGAYLRHKVKKPAPKKQIAVGGKYACGNGFYWVCICISGNKAWMNQDDGETAYVWTLDGESISLNNSYNINFSLSPSDNDRVPF